MRPLALLTAILAGGAVGLLTAQLPSGSLPRGPGGFNSIKPMRTDPADERRALKLARRFSTACAPTSTAGPRLTHAVLLNVTAAVTCEPKTGAVGTLAVRTFANRRDANAYMLAVRNEVGPGEPFGTCESDGTTDWFDRTGQRGGRLSCFVRDGKAVRVWTTRDGRAALRATGRNATTTDLAKWWIDHVVPENRDFPTTEEHTLVGGVRSALQGAPTGCTRNNDQAPPMAVAAISCTSTALRQSGINYLGVARLVKGYDPDDYVAAVVNIPANRAIAYIFEAKDRACSAQLFAYREWSDNTGRGRMACVTWDRRKSAGEPSRVLFVASNVKRHIALYAIAHSTREAHAFWLRLPY